MILTSNAKTAEGKENTIGERRQFAPYVIPQLPLHHPTLSRREQHGGRQLYPSGYIAPYSEPQAPQGGILSRKGIKMTTGWAVGKSTPKRCNACDLDKTAFMVEFSHTEDKSTWRVCTTCTVLILNWLAEKAQCREFAVLRGAK